MRGFLAKQIYSLISRIFRLGVYFVVSFNGLLNGGASHEARGDMS